MREAATLFARKGYAATGVAELGNAAGLGKGALYHHIGSKESLLFEVSKRHVEELLEYGEALLEDDLPADEKVRRVSRAHMRSIADHLPEVTVYFRDGHHLTGARKARVRALRDRWEGVWQRILEQGVEQGLFRSADPIAVKGVLGIYNYSWVWLHRDGALSTDEIADRLAGIALHGLSVDKP